MKNLTECVACGKKKLREILDLGAQPLANEYLQEVQNRSTYPLNLNLCELCTHVQLSVSIDPNVLFRNYSYVSSTSAVLSDYFTNLKNRIVNEFGGKGSILDIGSNDGSFLSKFEGTDWNTLGVDPASNLATYATKLGVSTLSAFYNTKTASLLKNDFTVAVAMNVFAHTSNPIEILNALKLNVSKSGYVFIQTSQANMFMNNEFDTVYHEHVSFFNVKSMKALLTRSGWELNDVSLVEVHGGSYLWKISRIRNEDPITFAREKEEEEFGFYNVSFYNSFSEKCQVMVQQVQKIINESRMQGFKIATYGAAAKGNTFLNFANVIPDYVFDDTPLKIGKYSPVANVIVSNPIEIKDLDAKLLFIIPAWNFSSEIKKKIGLLRNFRGTDRVLTYFPQIRMENV